MLSVNYAEYRKKPIILSIIMLNVIMLSVMAHIMDVLHKYSLVSLTLKANLVAVTHVYSNRYLDC
jgi:hypothetical protein